VTDVPDDAALRARLQASDPAASLPVADPARTARLLEDVMSTELTTESRESGTRGRSPLTWLVAAAAVLIIAGIGVFAAVGHDSGSGGAPTAGDQPSGSADTVTELAMPSGAIKGRCPVPTSELLSSQTVAFDATVVSVDAGVTTLEPTRWYAGEPTDLVRVQSPPESLKYAVGAVDFRDGRRYLVSATGGRLSVCGFTGPYSPDLAALYQRAFGD